MTAAVPNPIGTRSTLDLAGRSATVYRLAELERQGIGTINRLPFSIRYMEIGRASCRERV